MKRILIDLVVATLLTLPLYISLANVGAVNDWFLSGQGWATFRPLFAAGHAMGVDSNAAILIAAMLAISFLLALAGLELSRLGIRKITA